jgi:hypothetical protein
MAEPEVTLCEFTLSEADAEALMSWASDPCVAHFQRCDAYTRPTDHLRRRPPRGLHRREARRGRPFRQGVCGVPHGARPLGLRRGEARDVGGHGGGVRGVAVAAPVGGRGGRGEPGVAARAGEGRVRQERCPAAVHPAQGQAQGRSLFSLVDTDHHLQLERRKKKKHDNVTTGYSSLQNLNRNKELSLVPKEQIEYCNLVAPSSDQCALAIELNDLVSIS